MVLPEYFNIGNGSSSQGSIHSIYDLYWLFHVSEVFLQLQRFVRYDVIRIGGVLAKITHLENVMNAL